MHRFLLHNDEIRDTGERVVSPGQVGLVNGWGVFSTIRDEKEDLTNGDKKLLRQRLEKIKDSLS
jgi:hypothetical protein